MVKHHSQHNPAHRTARVRFPAAAEIFFLPLHPYQICLIGTTTSSMEIRSPGRETDHPSASRTENENVWSCASASECVSQLEIKKKNSGLL
jgi:hypothetical protein